MSEYNGLVFLGFSACIPRGQMPGAVYYSLVCPPIRPARDGSIPVAPNGLRKIEAALLESGFAREDVVAAHPDRLSEHVGPNTRILGLTENDPLGIGPATSTFTQVLGGEAYMKQNFKEILGHPAVRRYRPKIVVGGGGAWQLESADVRKELGIDCVVRGEGERSAVEVFSAILSGRSVPGVVHGEPVDADRIPVIQGPTIGGIVEIARGCSRGCAFCLPALQRYRCLSVEHILKEVDVNARAGRQPLLHAEDVLRYGASGPGVNERAVAGLFERVMERPGVRWVDISHFSLSSVAQAPGLISKISKVAGAFGKDRAWYSGETGIETGSPAMIQAHMRGKCRPFEPEDWPRMVVDAFGILADNNWVPVATLIIGLPGETPRDVDLTLDLVHRLRPFKSLIVPLFFVSEGDLRNRAPSLKMGDLGRERTRLLLEAWRHNLRWAGPLLEESSFLGNRLRAAALRLLARWGVDKVEILTRIAETDYDYDLQAMRKDDLEGRLKWLPFPVQSIYYFIRRF